MSGTGTPHVRSNSLFTRLSGTVTACYSSSTSLHTCHWTLPHVPPTSVPSAPLWKGLLGVNTNPTRNSLSRPQAGQVHSPRYINLVDPGDTSPRSLPASPTVHHQPYEGPKDVVGRSGDPEGGVVVPRAHVPRVQTCVTGPNGRRGRDAPSTPRPTPSPIVETRFEDVE